ncbi:hypothetical protein SAMN05216188_11954 [Lentzea xinjiangensis]|uniref:Uncharacterized protein n=1 Tax=Lentzea xinjiangensis TaxID=402600 RepID=A0A1H9TTK5_9PSEU|nr:hypothetical protein [Lentzea xinjiangensis]SES00321.1 hypothetical protein SAMN05216188_11954 [Lentzea xinjiangensis]
MSSDAGIRWRRLRGATGPLLQPELNPDELLNADRKRNADAP